MRAEVWMTRGESTSVRKVGRLRPENFVSKLCIRKQMNLGISVETQNLNGQTFDFPLAGEEEKNWGTFLLSKPGHSRGPEDRGLVWDLVGSYLPLTGQGETGGPLLSSHGQHQLVTQRSGG